MLCTDLDLGQKLRYSFRPSFQDKNKVRKFTLSSSVFPNSANDFGIYASRDAPFACLTNSKGLASRDAEQVFQFLDPF